MNKEDIKNIIEQYYAFTNDEITDMIQYLFDDIFSKYIVHDDKVYDIVYKKLKAKNINISKEKIKEVINIYLNYIVYIYAITNKKITLKRENGFINRIKYNEYKIRHLRKHLMKKVYFEDENI